MATPAGENTNKSAQDKKSNQEFAKETPAIGKKLTDLKKKEGTVTLITPPSWFHNQDVSFCLINLSKRDKEICDMISSTLVENGIIFAGIDIIGDYLTEINITSPTGMREIDKQNQYSVSAILFNELEKILNER